MHPRPAPDPEAPGPRSPDGAPIEVKIERLGREGDGIGSWGSTPVFIRGALPGDEVQVRIRGRRGRGLEGVPDIWLKRGERAQPPCPHFDASDPSEAIRGSEPLPAPLPRTCGGCRLQHLPEPLYLAFRRGVVEHALRAQGLEAPVRTALPIPQASRRRVRLAFSCPFGGPTRLGYRGRASHDIVDITVCPVARPEIVALLPGLRDLLPELGVPSGEVTLTVSETGRDVLFHLASPLGIAERQALVGAAESLDLARIALAVAGSQPEPVVVRRAQTITFDGIEAPLPPGAFLQASTEAEAAIRTAVREGLGGAERIADLFSGLGTFALPEAGAGRRVLALESERTLVDGLLAAARAGGIPVRSTPSPDASDVRRQGRRSRGPLCRGQGSLDARRQDLERMPLRGPALRVLDAVILDPPRRGARAQCEALAASGVPRVVMVSCDPDTFARDARLLEDGGYRLLWVQPVDAFLWSLETEVVGVFDRS